MKRLLSLMVPAMALAACSGTSSVHVALNSDDTQSTSQQPLSDAPPAADLTTVQHVNVTVTEVDVHVSDEGTGSTNTGSGSAQSGSSQEANDDVRGEDVSDTDSGWHVISSTAKTVDLMGVRGTATADLADGTVPAGRITQVRLKLQSSGDAGNGDDKITGAVVDADGTTCDLIVPHSAINPGIKIVGTFKAAHIAGGAAYNAVVNLPLKDSTRLTAAGAAGTCAFRLSPVIRLKSVEAEPRGSH